MTVSYTKKYETSNGYYILGPLENKTDGISNHQVLKVYSTTTFQKINEEENNTKEAQQEKHMIEVTKTLANQNSHESNKEMETSSIINRISLLEPL